MKRPADGNAHLPHERAVCEREQLRILRTKQRVRVSERTCVAAASLGFRVALARTTFSIDAQAVEPAVRRDRLELEPDLFMVRSRPAHPPTRSAVRAQCPV